MAYAPRDQTCSPLRAWAVIEAASPQPQSGRCRKSRDKNPIWGDIVHAQRVQLQHPEVTAIFDIDQTAAAATPASITARLAREHVLIAGPHMPFSCLG